MMTLSTDTGTVSTQRTAHLGRQPNLVARDPTRPQRLADFLLVLSQQRTSINIITFEIDATHVKKPKSPETHMIRPRVVYMPVAGLQSGRDSGSDLVRRGLPHTYIHPFVSVPLRLWMLTERVAVPSATAGILSPEGSVKCVGSSDAPEV